MPSLEARHANLNRKTRMYVFDVFRPDLGIDDQRVVLRHDLQELGAGSNGSSYGMDGKINDSSSDGCRDLESLDLVLYRLKSLQ